MSVTAQINYYASGPAHSPEEPKPSPVVPDPELLPLFDKDYEPISSDLDNRLGKAIGTFSFAAFDRLNPEPTKEQSNV
jgi:hypothetical protein